MAAKIVHLVQTIELRRLIQASRQLQQRILELFPDLRDLEEGDLKDFFSEARVDRLEDPTDDNQIIRLVREVAVELTSLHAESPLAQKLLELLS